MVRQSCAGVFIALLCLFCACGVPYDRYMQEGHKFREQRENAKARKSFHKAVLEARNDGKKKELLIDALLAEKDCAVDLQENDDAMTLLAEAARVLENADEFKRAALIQQQMGELSASASAADALEFFKAGLADLKKAGFETSPEAAAILAAIADLKSSQNDLKSAAHYLESSCSILDKIKYNENNHAHAIYLHKLAFIYQQLNRDNDGIDADEKAKALEMSGIKDSVEKLPKF